MKDKGKRRTLVLCPVNQAGELLFSNGHSEFPPRIDTNANTTSGSINSQVIAFGNKYQWGDVDKVIPTEHPDVFVVRVTKPGRLFNVDSEKANQAYSRLKLPNERRAGKVCVATLVANAVR
jgi:hypothetical protein